MALYQYHCPECLAVFDLFVPVEERDEVQECPHGHTGATRLFQSPAIIQPDRRKSFRQAMGRTPGKHFT